MTKQPTIIPSKNYFKTVVTDITVRQIKYMIFDILGSFASGRLMCVSNGSGKSVECGVTDVSQIIFFYVP